MKIKVDEDLPKRVTVSLRELDYQADTVIEQGMSGWKDTDLWGKIQEENRFLLAIFL